MSARPHGYARYKLDGCRCYVCGFAVSNYEQRRQKAMIAGTWQPYMPTEPVRQHLADLAAAGVGYKTAARRAGVSITVVRQLIWGRGHNSGRPNSGRSEKVKTDTARRLLAVRPTLDVIRDHAVIPAAGTTRRIQAMTVTGWTLTRQAEQVGMSLSNYARLVDVDAVIGRTARAVAATYDALTATEPPATVGTARAKKWAAARHFLPPIVWDDDEIDDPAAVPCVLPPVVGSMPVDEHALTVAYLYRDHPIPAELRDELVWRLLAGGYSHAQIAQVARTTKGYIGVLSTKLHRDRGQVAA